jgi:hypothetical protein
MGRQRFATIVVRLRTVGAICVAASCAAHSSLSQQAAALHRGEPRSRAVQLLGAPDDTQAEDDDEVLLYCRSSSSEGTTDSSDYVLVWLNKDAVTGLTTYRRAPAISSSCAAGFKAIHWEDAPDRTAAPGEP